MTNVILVNIEKIRCLPAEATTVVDDFALDLIFAEIDKRHRYSYSSLW